MKEKYQGIFFVYLGTENFIICDVLLGTMLPWSFFMVDNTLGRSCRGKSAYLDTIATLTQTKSINNVLKMDGCNHRHMHNIRKMISHDLSALIPSLC